MYTKVTPQACHALWMLSSKEAISVSYEIGHWEELMQLLKETEVPGGVLMLCQNKHQQAGKSVIQNEIMYAPIKDYLLAKETNFFL